MLPTVKKFHTFSNPNQNLSQSQRKSPKRDSCYKTTIKNKWKAKGKFYFGSQKAREEQALANMK